MLLLTKKAEPSTIDDIDGPETPAKRRLIAAGEQMMGQDGIANAPLHEVAALAGQSNRYAVQYHFGDRAGLVGAILSIRRRRLVARRHDLFEAAKEKDLLSDTRALLEIIFLPTAEQVDPAGHHSYARFLLQFLSRVDFDPVVEDPFRTSGDIKREMTGRIADLMGIPFPLMEWRCYLQHFAMLAALGSWDNPRFPVRKKLPIEAVVAEAIGSIAAAMEAPMTDPATLLPALPNYGLIPID